MQSFVHILIKLGCELLILSVLSKLRNLSLVTVHKHGGLLVGIKFLLLSKLDHMLIVKFF